jgi:hypothetical protein
MTNEQPTKTVKSCCFELAGFFHDGAVTDINEFLGGEAIGRELVVAIQNEEGTRRAELVFTNTEAKLLNLLKVEGKSSDCVYYGISEHLTSSELPTSIQQ